MRWIEVTAAVFLMLLALPIIAAANEPIPCADIWRPIDDYVLAREDEASIQHQCRSSEKPCPPRTELVRRATLVARTYAMAAIRAAVAATVSQEVVVSGGIASDRVTLRTEGTVYDVVACRRVEGDRVRVRVIVEVKK
jgi:hypothetical protein